MAHLPLHTLRSRTILTWWIRMDWCSLTEPVMEGRNVSVEEEHDTPLQVALCQGHDQIVQRLLEKQGDINAPEGRGYGTALEAASYQGHD
jgi:hypothetical protein